MADEKQAAAAEAAPAKAQKPRGGKYIAKVPKGTRDIDPFQSAVREDVLNKVTSVFKKHGAVTIETPVFELKDTLTGKYGEDSKLIYDLQDQGGEICSLRYDLTVPFARHVAMNKLQAMRRYQIAKVYRRDQPAMNRGKYREFYQCDFDIAGATDTMIAEAECVSMMAEILSALDIGGFCIKLNHRKLLDGIFAVCGVPEEKFRPICSAVDKLDKSPWEEVRKEMVEQKGLDGAVADRIWEFVSMKEVEPEALLARLKAGQLAGLDASAKALEELGTLFEYLAAYGVRPPVVSFDLSLARGLDYYTGLIYEAVRTSGELGSVAGGGRYDELVGIFSSRQVPCVGFSVGIERLFAILEENAKRKGNLRPYSTQVMVVSMGGKENLVPARLGLLRQLWDAGIAAEHLAKAHNKPKPQLDYASHHGIPLAVIVGASEMERSVVSIKDLRTGQQTNDVPRADMAATVNAMLGGASPAAASATPTPASGASAASAPSPAAQAPAPAADTPPAAEKPAEGAAAADAKGKKGKQKGVKAGAAAVPRPEYCDHRIAMFERIKAENEAAAAAKAAEGKPIKVTLPDGAVKEGVAFKTSPMDIAFGISKGLANRVLVAKVNGNIWDLCRPMEEDSALELCDFETPEGKHTFWHSTAHMMGEALELQWGVNLCIGPCNGTDQGFFYDSFMGDRVISEEDYKTVEQGVQKVANAKQKFERVVITVEQALEIFRHNKFKCELISKFADAGTTMTAYRCGDLVDLCRGPHVPNTSVVKAMMVTNHGQAYWLADAKNASLQRVYGVSFPDKKQLAEYQHFLAEAKKRDHRLLGVKQELFFFDQLSPGSAFFLPLGARIYNTLMELMRQEYRKRGFEEVLTPNVYNMKLWETSGHAANYKENMFLFDVEGQCFGLKPMNCPGHCLMFKHRVRSWRELPLRLADFGVLHRNEMSGALTGLTRVRRFQQDDAHIFCMPDQVEAEIEGALDFLRHTYQIFGFEFHLLLSTRPEKYIGEIETWNTAEKSLENALNASGLKWELNEGDGAFYGPKIDIQVSDALRRKHQCATIQLDFQLPIRFGLEFAAPEGAGSEARTARPVMIHRAILGSVERMISILTEHFGGKWPFWLSPRQAIVIPVAVELIPQATEIKERLHAAGIYAEVDDSHKQLPKKVREAQLEQWNYLLVVGPEEVRTGTVAVRSRQEHEKDRDVERGNWDVNDLVAEFVRLRDTRVREVIATRPTLRPEAPAAEEAKEAKPEGQ